MTVSVRQRLGGRVDFRLGGWRLWAYWFAVMFAGVVIGVRFGHPGINLLPWFPGFVDQAPSLATARAVTHGLSGIALVLIVAIVGREAFIPVGDDGE